MEKDKLESFVSVDHTSDFPIQNLPFGIFQRKGEDNSRVGVAIGKYILDLSVLEAEGILKTNSKKSLFNRSQLNKFMEQGRTTWSKVRQQLQKLLSTDDATIRDNTELRNRVLINQDECEMLLPVETTDYTDFYASKHHAFNVGTMFRGPENALMENWVHLPVGYHGRASSIIPSGIDIKRPKGQLRPPGSDKPYFGPSKRLDYEYEMGIYVGVGNKLGNPIPIDEWRNHIFGLVILNDWSARDVQGWEYRPLGPFLGKNFATSISPWVVTLEALEAFEIELDTQEPEVLDYLKEEKRISYDIKLEVKVKTEKSSQEYSIATSNFNNLYWTISQMLAHHSITGCNMSTGDLMGTGTISGSAKDTYASLLESSWGGTEPLILPNGEERKFLEDGDTVIMKAYCENNQYRIGFGEVRSKILPSN